MARSDSTASTLTWIIFELLEDQALLIRPQQAVNEVVGDTECLDCGDVEDIPSNIIIWQPIHTIQRDERYLRDATTFKPERWFEEKQAEWIHDRRAFIPFSYGSYKCIGNNLAMMEMRAATTNLVYKFDMKAAPGEKFDALENKTRDTFALTSGKLEVVPTKRSARRGNGA